jgi:hypothetical protein
MDESLYSIATKEETFDKLRLLSPEALARLEHYYVVELTYPSNAIEGNTPSPVETILVIEKGITISGQPLKDHLEALDHYDAIRYVRELGRQTAPLTNGERPAQSPPADDAAHQPGDCRPVCRPRPQRSHVDRETCLSISSGNPSLMGDFGGWFGPAPATPETAFMAHLRRVDIHRLPRG